MSCLYLAIGSGTILNAFTIERIFSGNSTSPDALLTTFLRLRGPGVLPKQNRGEYASNRRDAGTPLYPGHTRIIIVPSFQRILLFSPWDHADGRAL
jgi:hypothetical protein